MDDQAGVDVAMLDGAKNLVVAHLDDVTEVRSGQPQQPIGRRFASRNGDPAGGGVAQRLRLARDHERPHTASERGAASQKPVPLSDTRERSHAQLRELEAAVMGPAVQLFEEVVERHQAAWVRLEERERVVRTRREAERHFTHEARPATSTGVAATIAAHASSIRHVDRSDSSIRLEMARTSIAGTPASAAARSTAKPSIASTSQPDVRPTRPLVPMAPPRDAGNARQADATSDGSGSNRRGAHDSGTLKSQ